MDDIELGMYVAELDRPWEDTPFLIQGLLVKTAEDIEQLQALCDFVYIDDERSQDDDRTIRRSVNMQPSAQSRITRSEWHTISVAEQKLSFEQEVQRAASLRSTTRTTIGKLFKEMRMGFAVETETAKEVVHELVESVAADADAALWLTNLKDVHDYTAQHCMNVSVLSVVFGKHLGFTKEQLKLIGLGALLHDIGKMNTPTEILDKPGRLSPEEFEIIKRHPVDGHAAMAATGKVPQQALQVIKYHHERLSGRGYPDGLRGDQISTAVLIVAIADMYDAITSDRAYHKGIPAYEALQALYKIASTEFGKPLVEEFIRCMGIYPIGSVVELTTGDIGVVMTSDPRSRLRPVVLLIRAADGTEYSPRRYVSLAAMAEAKGGRDWSVRRILDPSAIGISIQQIADEEIFSGSSEVLEI